MMPFKERKETTHLFKGCSWFFLLFFSPFFWEGALFLLLLPSGHRKGISSSRRCWGHLQCWGQSVVAQPAPSASKLAVPTALCLFLLAFPPLYWLGIHIPEEENDVLFYLQISLRKAGQG